MRLFRTNNVDIAFDRLQYDFVKVHETLKSSGFGGKIVIMIRNPYQRKIRSEKQIAMVLGSSRSQVKSLLEKGKIELKVELSQSISFSINPCWFSVEA